MVVNISAVLQMGEIIKVMFIKSFHQKKKRDITNSLLHGRAAGWLSLGFESEAGASARTTRQCRSV